MNKPINVTASISSLDGVELRNILKKSQTGLEKKMIKSIACLRQESLEVTKGPRRHCSSSSVLEKDAKKKKSRCLERG